MVVCKRCQSENSEQTRFCTFCGGRLPGKVEPMGIAPGSAAPKSARPAPLPQSDPEAQARYVQKVVYQHFIRAKELIRERKFDAAIKEFKKALEVSPGEPTITEMMAKTIAAQKAAVASTAEAPAPVKFRPASVPTPPAPPPSARPDIAAARSTLARKPVTDQWLKSLAATPSLYPSMVLDTPTHERITEVAVTALILSGLAFFAWLLMM